MFGTGLPFRTASRPPGYHSPQEEPTVNAANGGQAPPKIVPSEDTIATIGPDPHDDTLTQSFSSRPGPRFMVPTNEDILNGSGVAPTPVAAAPFRSSGLASSPPPPSSSSPNPSITSSTDMSIQLRPRPATNGKAPAGPAYDSDSDPGGRLNGSEAGPGDSSSDDESTVEILRPGFGEGAGRGAAAGAGRSNGLGGPGGRGLPAKKNADFDDFLSQLLQGVPSDKPGYDVTEDVEGEPTLEIERGNGGRRGGRARGGVEALLGAGENGAIQALLAAGPGGIGDGDMARLLELLGGGKRRSGHRRDRSRKDPRKSQWSPLHYAAQQNKVTLGRKLLEKGAAVDPREEDDWTPLIMAAQNGHVEILNVLLDHNADINARANDGRPALFQATQNGHVGVVRALLARQPQVDLGLHSGSSPLWLACYQAGRKKNPEPFIEILGLLIEARANVNQTNDRGIYPLTMAVAMENVRVATILLSAGADVNIKEGIKESSPLGLAALDANPELVRLCVGYDAYVDAREARGWTPLHMAAQNIKPHTLEVCQILLDKGANPDARTNEGASAMHLACQEGNVELVDLLCQARADANIRGRNGRSPVFSAVLNGHADCFENLVKKHGAKVDIVDDNGMTLMHIVAMQDDPTLVSDVVTLCQEAGMDINSRSKDRNLSPLHLASQNDVEEIALCFLEMGALP